MHRRSALAAVRKSAGYTQESLAAALGIDRSTVNRWEAGKNDPLPYLRPKLARLLGQSTQQLQELIGDDLQESDIDPVNVDLDRAIDWLSQNSEWSPFVARRKVQSAITRVKVSDLVAQHAKRSRVRRSVVASQLAKYYREEEADTHLYRARCDGNVVTTSILTRCAWQDLTCPLGHPHEKFKFLGASKFSSGVDHVDASRAARRIAESVVTGTRLVDSPIYRLLSIQAQEGQIIGTFGLASFVEYALTADLLESELLDALVAGTVLKTGSLPLRERYLPHLAAVSDFSRRLCAGGVVSLCAITRPADRYRGPADYALLVQERSAHVLNAVRQLSVMPKGFHRPLVDYQADVQVSATLRRELEEELFGRQDVDTTISRHMAASPMHPSRLSEPMRWLSGCEVALKIECTGFGLNLVSGNYEFATLLVIDDEDFWARYGGEIQTNWESAGVQIFSSLDRELLSSLVSDERWSNEGIFAFLQGLRRLKSVGGKRVNVPDIEIVSP